MSERRADELVERWAVEQLGVAGGPLVSAPDVLTVIDVMARYRLCDRRAARRIMDEAGAFKLGANLFVRLDDLLALEEAQKAARKRGSLPTQRDHPGRPPARPTARKPSTVREPLRPGWWREVEPGGSLGAPANEEGGG